MIDNEKLKDLLPGDYFIHAIPNYISQFSSRDLISDFLDKKIPLEEDPQWTKFGFSSVKEYVFWSQRLCGLICTKMVFDVLAPKSEETVASLTDKAVKKGAYIIYNENGEFVDKGWFYAPLIELAQEYGLEGDICTNLSKTNLCEYILKDKYPIVSVHPGVIRFDFEKCPNNKKGGHLVLVIGFRWNGENCEGFYIHNPSGRVKDTQEKAFIPIKRFEEAFALRGFVLGKLQESNEI